jgi:hypothetical protein
LPANGEEDRSADNRNESPPMNADELPMGRPATLKHESAGDFVAWTGHEKR